MFAAEYQGGSSVEVFSAQGSNPLSAWRTHGKPLQKELDKEVKGIVFVVDGAAALSAPKEEKQTLGLLQRYVIFQLLVPQGRDFTLSLLVSDSTGAKRRLALSTQAKETKVSASQARIALSLRAGVWLNLCLDLGAIITHCFPSLTFRALEAISVGASCRLRRIFTMRNRPIDLSSSLGTSSADSGDPTEMIPAKHALSSSLSAALHMISLANERVSDDECDLNATSLRGHSLDTTALREQMASRASLPTRGGTSVRKSNTGFASTADFHGAEASPDGSDFSPSASQTSADHLLSVADGMYTYSALPRTPPVGPRSPRKTSSTERSLQFRAQPEDSVEPPSSSATQEHPLSQSSASKGLSVSFSATRPRGDSEPKSPHRDIEGPDPSTSGRHLPAPPPSPPVAGSRSAVRSNRAASRQLPTPNASAASRPSLPPVIATTTTTAEPKQEPLPPISATKKFVVADANFLKDEAWRNATDSDDDDDKPQPAAPPQPRPSLPSDPTPSKVQLVAKDAGRVGALTDLRAITASIHLANQDSDESDDELVELPATRPTSSSAMRHTRISFDQPLPTTLLQEEPISDDMGRFSPPVQLASGSTNESVDLTQLSEIFSRSKSSETDDESRGMILMEESGEELELRYDPMLNCYYDPTTSKYYELI
eukprot:m.195579 g.195579  ORF g.195579 m.195579 type:complete len:657 (+) comp53724_c0_seq2:105-2075(+)